MMTRVLLWLLGAIAAGLVLVLWGLRGKRINDHPVCRQCRFDLSGAPQGTITCPECGAGLKRPGSTRIGQRRRRPIAIAAGIAAILFPGATIAVTGFALLTGSDVHKYMPLGVLLWESRHADATRSKAIATELKSRYAAKALDEPQIARVVACALEVQENTRIPWATEWGDLIEDARTDGKLKEPDESRFRTHAASVAWKARPRVRAGDPIPVIASLKEARIGSATMLNTQVWYTGAEIDGTKAKKSRVKQPGSFGSVETGPVLGWFQLMGNASRVGWTGAYGQARVMVDCPKDLPPGRHTLRVKLSMQTKPMARFGGLMPNSPPKDDPDVHTVQGECIFEVLAAEAEVVTRVEPAPDVAEKMAKALQPSQLRVWRYRSTLLQECSSNMSFAIDSCPLPGAFDVFWRAGGQEHRVGVLTTGTSADPWVSESYGPGMGNSRYLGGSVGRDFDATTVDVILRPSTQAALRTVDIDRIYGAEIVIKDQPVTFQDEGGQTYTPSGKPRPPSLFKTLERLFGNGG